MKLFLGFGLLLFILDTTDAAVSLADILSINPAELLTEPPISDADKRRLIDCLDGVKTISNCPDVPTTDAFKKLRDLIIRTKKNSKNKGLVGGLLGAVGSLLNGGNTGVTGLLTEASKNAATILKVFDQIKTLFEKQNIGLPEDPYRDISEYMKSTAQVKVDLVQAVKTRSKVMKAFASTSDDILHKYASNYDVLNPHVSLVGVVRMLLDIYS